MVNTNTTTNNNRDNNMTTHDKLAAAICAIMAEIGTIKATGQNSHQRYSYASDADLLRAIQPAMANNGVAMAPTSVTGEPAREVKTAKGGTAYRADLMVTYLVWHTGSAETVAVMAPGCGVDSQDKAVYKAMTGAYKYALRQLYAIPTGDDPERDQRPTARPAATPPRQPATLKPITIRAAVEPIAASLMAAGDGDPLDAIDKWLVSVDRPVLADMTPDKYRALVAWLTGGEGRAQIARWAGLQ